MAKPCTKVSTKVSRDKAARPWASAGVARRMEKWGRVSGMAFALYTHADMFDHRPGEGHPERPERLRAVVDALDDDATLDMEPYEAPLADLADLQLVHPEAYVNAILGAEPSSGLRRLDPD